MTKDEQIKEMAKVLQEEQIKISNTADEFKKFKKVGICFCNAEALYNAGYRKADEVRKETAKKKNALYVITK